MHTICEALKALKAIYVIQRCVFNKHTVHDIFRVTRMNSYFLFGRVLACIRMIYNVFKASGIVLLLSISVLMRY